MNKNCPFNESGCCWKVIALSANTQLCQKKTPKNNNPSSSEQAGDYCASRHFQRVNSCFLKAAAIKWWTSSGRRSAKAANVVVNSCQDGVSLAMSCGQNETCFWNWISTRAHNSEKEESTLVHSVTDKGFKERDTGLISVLMVMSVKTPIFDPKSQFTTFSLHSLRSYLFLVKHNWYLPWSLVLMHWFWSEKGGNKDQWVELLKAEWRVVTILVAVDATI